MTEATEPFRSAAGGNVAPTKAASVADPLDHWRADTGGLRCPIVSGLAVELIDGECSACGEPALAKGEQVAPPTDTAQSPRDRSVALGDPS